MTSVYGKIVLVPVVLCVLAANLRPAAKPNSPSAEEIERAVRQLGDENFTVREKASAFLWAAGKAAESALERAAKGDDVETVRRAREILAKFRYGIYPDTPADVARLIARYRSGDPTGKEGVVKELFKQGAAGRSALYRLIATEEDANIRRSLSEQIGQEAAGAADKLIADGNFAGAEDLLEVGLTSTLSSAVRNYAAYQLLRGHLDEKIGTYKSLADKGDQQAAEVLTYLYRARGDLKRARQAAEQSGKAALLEPILFELGDWKGAARILIARRDVEPGVKATYARLAGNLPECELELRKLAELKSQYTAPALFFNDRPQQAIDSLSGSRRFADAFEFLALQLKFRQALELADRVQDNAGDDWMALQTLKARTLYQLGEKERALKVFADLAAKAKDLTDDQVGALIEALYQVGLKDEAFEHCGRMLASAKEGNQGLALARVFPGRKDAAEVWWKFFRGKHPTEEPGETLKRVRLLLDRKKPGEDFPTLVRAVEQMGAGAPAEQRGVWLRALAETCRVVGKEDLAGEYFEKTAQASAAADDWVRLGDFLADRKSWPEAAAAYRKAWHKDQKLAAALYLWGWALARGGQDKEGRKLMERAHWLPLGNDGVRYALGEALAKHGLTEDALRERDLIRLTGEFQSVYLTNVLNRDGEDALARQDYDRAAVAAERVMLTVLQTGVTFIKVRAYLFVPYSIHRNRALALLAAGKTEEARKEADVCLAALPGDIELAIHLVPEFNKRGHKQDADELFDKVFAVHRRLCAEYPKSGWCHNNLAWLTARCRRQLDVGMEHSQKAVELAPGNAGHLDTLAEVYFQRGEKDRAVTLMKKCMTMEPKNDYFRKQLKRFEAGDPGAELPGEG